MKLDKSMSFRATTLRQRLLGGLLLSLITSPVFGQVKDAPIVFANQDAIVTTLVQPVGLSSGGNQGSSSSFSNDSNQWLKVEFHFGVVPPPQKGNFVDEVEFKVWVEGRDLLDPAGQPGQGIAVGLTGSVTYVNLAKAKDTYGVFYVHPSTLARYSTDRGGANDFLRTFDVHVEAYVNGQLVDAVDKNKETDITWYQKLKAIPSLVFRQNQCIFIAMDPGRYPAIKIPADAGK